MKIYGFDNPSPTVLEIDNLGALHLPTKSVFHGQTKHIKLQYHWIREVVESGNLVICHCPTENMIADVLTKCLGKAHFRRLRGKIGVL